MPILYVDIDLKKYLLVASQSLLKCDKDLGILTPRCTTACDSFHPDVKFASVEWLLYHFSLNRNATSERISPHQSQKITK